MMELTSRIVFVSMLLGAALMLALLGFFAAVIMPGIDRWSKRFFIVFFTVLVLYTGMCIVEAFYIPFYVSQTLEIEIIYYLETLLASALMPLMTAFLVHCCGENWRHSRLLHVVAALWTGAFILLSISPFTSLIYYVTPENQFLRGPLYSLILVFYNAIMILNLAGVIRHRDRLSKRYFFAFLIGLFPMAISIFCLFFISSFTFFGISVAICALTMYGMILSDQIRQYMRLQQDIAHQRASVMVLQMRPHFIYNTMMSIYYLCKQNPDLAQQVTLDFTTYLRKNFTAIASEEPIPFLEELEHTRAYLAVEQAQFEDSLFVDYDTPHIDFCLPPLTLQPIVENAVKHGMDQDSEPLHIFIRTSRTETGSEIIVENNGPDFKPAADSEPHIALKNIQQRLEMMCRGKMSIVPRQGGGTVVRMTIP